MCIEFEMCVVHCALCIEMCIVCDVCMIYMSLIADGESCADC